MYQMANSILPFRLLFICNDFFIDFSLIFNPCLTFIYCHLLFIVIFLPFKLLQTMTMFLHMTDEHILWQCVIDDIYARVLDMTEHNEDNRIETERRLKMLAFLLEMVRFDVQSIEQYLPCVLWCFLEMAYLVMND